MVTRSIATSAAVALAGVAAGDVVVYTERAAWEAAAGAPAAIDFVGLPDGTIVTSQYQAAHGVLFTGGEDRIRLDGVFQNDGAGLQSGFGDIRVAFDTPRTAMGVEFLAEVQIVLFCEQYQAFYMSQGLVKGESDFVGVIADEPFDAVVVRDPEGIFGEMSIDDLFLGPPAPAGGPAGDSCPGPEPLIGPDLLAIGMPGIATLGNVGGINGYAFGSDYCNIGDAVEPVSPLTNQHPVFTMNMYRLREGRFEQIGMSWVKHTFGANVTSACGPCQDPGSIEILGIGCSDVYGSVQNGGQAGFDGMSGLGPRSDINPFTGEYPFPYTTQGAWGDDIYKRLQVHDQDLDPALNPGALYFGEEHFIGPRDSAWGNGGNNIAHRPIAVLGREEAVWILSFSAPATPGEAALAAWREVEPTVTIETMDIPEDGRLVLAHDCRDNGDGTWHYEFALHNLNAHRAARRFEVPIPPGVNLTNVGFHDVEYHSGELYDSSDWSVQQGEGAISWSTASFAENEFANALRWATVYNFRFDADAPPRPASGLVEFFRPGVPPALPISLCGPGPRAIPGDVNGDGSVDVADLVQVILSWGPCPAPPTPCPADADGSAAVDVSDLTIVILNWT